MLMCKHCLEALKHLQSAYHRIENQHAGQTLAALMQCAGESQFIHHRELTEKSLSSGAEL